MSRDATALLYITKLNLSNRLIEKLFTGPVCLSAWQLRFRFWSAVTYVAVIHDNATLSKEAHSTTLVPIKQNTHI